MTSTEPDFLVNRTEVKRGEMSTEHCVSDNIEGRKGKATSKVRGTESGIGWDKANADTERGKALDKGA